MVNNFILYRRQNFRRCILLIIYCFFPLTTCCSETLSAKHPLTQLHPPDIKIEQAGTPQKNSSPPASGNDDSRTIVENFVISDATVETPEIINIYNELFRITYASAPDIRIARALKKQKSAQRYTAWAKRLAPAVDAKLRQVHEFDSDSTIDSNAEETQADKYSDGEDYQDWGFILDLPVYRRQVSLRVNIAQAEERLAENNLLIKTQELDLRLRELLGNYLTASYRLLNLRDSIRLSREHVDKIHRGYELRDQTKLQLLRAQANLKELEARRDLDEQRRDAAFRALLDYTGLHVETSIFPRLDKLLTDEVSTAGCINSLSDVEQSLSKIQHFVETADDAELRHFFIEHSLLYKKISMERHLANQQALTYTENEWPGLSIRGLYDRRENTKFNDFNGEGSLALVLSVPLFTGGTIISNSKTRTMAQHIADVTQYEALRKAVHAMENNRKLIVSLDKVYTTQQIHLQQQREIVILSLKSYTIKQTSMQDLLTSQNRLIDAKNALVETTNKLGSLYRQFAWQLGTPYQVPFVE